MILPILFLLNSPRLSPELPNDRISFEVTQTLIGAPRLMNSEHEHRILGLL